MPENTILVSMSKYDAKTAILELDLIESKLMEKAEKYLESNNSFEVTKIYSLVRKELYNIDKDARRLKLTGELDSEMYGVMSEGYRDIGIRLIRISHEYSLGNKVLKIHDTIRFSEKINSTYLTEYMREDDPKA